MAQKRWIGFAGQLLLIALSLLPIWLMTAPADTSPPPHIQSFEVPLPESGQYFSGKLVASRPFP